ncbi:response regulator [Streptomyces sparsogenes]|uniref:response regulator n=1 Tax=Streptomyces sparsogenes TaxID=67365 RepID=UPI00332EEEE4
MRELRPLGDGLSQECRDFALALRDLFKGLDVSVRRYAARRHRDPGTFSRYLSGTRIPPWEFVQDLFTDLAERRGSAATPAAIELVRELHRAAVHTSGSPGHAMEILQHQLADADREARASSVKEDALGEALLDRQHRIADLEVRLSQMEGAWVTERTRADALELGLPDHAELVKERDMLRREVKRLTEELEDVRLRGMLAEDRCQMLERQLAMVESQRPATAREPEEVPDAPVGPAMSKPCSGPRPKILVVDDQPNNLLAMEAVLATLDQELVTASSGQEALKALLDHDDFAVILLDVQMPEMDGYETAAHIQRRPRNRDIPIIFLTAMGADPEHSSRGYAAGAVDYIAKPFDPWALRAKVSVFTEIFLERRRYSERAAAH